MPAPQSPVPGVLHDAAFASALRAAIAHRGLALHRIKARLAENGVHVGLATLSSWQNGTRVPSPESRPVLAALEQLLEVPQGWLAARTGPTAQRRTRPFTSLAHNGAALNRLLDQVQREAYGRTRTVLLVEELRFGPDRALSHKSVLQTVAAVAPTDRQIVTHTSEAGADPDLIGVRAVSGGRIGRVARDRDPGAVLFEFLLDRMLQVGEPAVLRYELEDRNPTEACQYTRVHHRDGAHHLIELHFDPRALPVRVCEFRRSQVGAPDSFRRELRITPEGHVQMVATSVESGIVGVDWEWGTGVTTPAG